MPLVDAVLATPLAYHDFELALEAQCRAPALKPRDHELHVPRPTARRLGAARELAVVLSKSVVDVMRGADVVSAAAAVVAEDIDHMSRHDAGAPAHHDRARKPQGPNRKSKKKEFRCGDSNPGCLGEDQVS